MASVSTSYARIADRYERVRGGDERATVLGDALLPWLPAGGVIADVGAGTCVISERLATATRDVVALDLSREMLRQAPTRLPGRRSQADAAALPLRTHSVDAVTFVWVLHHVGDLPAVLREVRRVLRPGGRMLSISGRSLPVDDDMGPIFEGLTDRLRPGQRKQQRALASLGTSLGLRHVDEVLVESNVSSSPNELATAIEAGLFSFVWDLSEQGWQTHVAPALDDLRSLPDPERPRTRVFHNPLVILEQPPSAVEPDGGENACWLDQVCPECGRMIEVDGHRCEAADAAPG